MLPRDVPLRCDVSGVPYRYRRSQSGGMCRKFALHTSTDVQQPERRFDRPVRVVCITRSGVNFRYHVDLVFSRSAELKSTCRLHALDSLSGFDMDRFSCGALPCLFCQSIRPKHPRPGSNLRAPQCLRMMKLLNGKSYGSPS